MGNGFENDPFKFSSGPRHRSDTLQNSELETTRRLFRLESVPWLGDRMSLAKQRVLSRKDSSNLWYKSRELEKASCSRSEDRRELTKFFEVEGGR